MSESGRWVVSASWDQSMTLHCPDCGNGITLDDSGGNWPTLAEMRSTTASHRCTIEEAQ